jgi:hypothetical protein
VLHQKNFETILFLNLFKNLSEIAIKQHLNIPTLFGTTKNAVYGQLFSALIVYVSCCSNLRTMASADSCQFSVASRLRLQVFFLHA